MFLILTDNAFLLSFRLHFIRLCGHQATNRLQEAPQAVTRLGAHNEALHVPVRAGERLHRGVVDRPGVAEVRLGAHEEGREVGVLLEGLEPVLHVAERLLVIEAEHVEKNAHGSVITRCE